VPDLQDDYPTARRHMPELRLELQAEMTSNEVEQNQD
jgi:hypothetical protein